MQDSRISELASRLYDSLNLLQTLERSIAYLGNTRESLADEELIRLIIERVEAIASELDDFKLPDVVSTSAPHP